MKTVLNPQHIELESVMGLDLETSGLKPWQEQVRLIILSTSEATYLLDVKKYSPDYLKELMWALSQIDVVVAHNAKFDCGFIYYHYGVLFRNWFCTQIASQVLTNGVKEYKGHHTLPEVISRYLKVNLTFTAKNKKLLQKSFTSQYGLQDFTDKQLQYASEDVKYLIPLYKQQQKYIDQNLLKPIIALENKLIPVLAKMENEGCLIDAENWRKLIYEVWEPEMSVLEGRLDDEVRKLIPSYGYRRNARVEQFDLFGGSSVMVLPDRRLLNYSSSEQLIELFRELGEEVPSIEVEQKEKEDDDAGDTYSQSDLFAYSMVVSDNSDLEYISGEKITKETLEEGVLTTYLNERPNSRMKPFIELLLEYRVAAKRISTYGEKFLAQLDKNGYIHTGYTQTFTDTGRLSSKAPNLQNIPAPEKGKDWTNIRKFFIARPGYKLITCDMAGAEVSIAADYSQEPLLLDSIKAGADMHSKLASVSFSIICGEDVSISKSEEPIYIKGHELIPVELRDLHKSVVFAKFYKGGAKRVYGVLAKYINLFHPESKRMEIASEVSKALDQEMPKLSEYLSSLITKAHKEGYLRGSKLGRIRYFTEDDYGEIANFPIQNTNAEALKMAMIRVFEYIEENNLDARIVLNVHDELMVEAHDSVVEQVAENVKQIMADCLSYFLKTIKGGASVNIGNYWKK